MPRLSLRTWILLPAWTLVTGLILVLSASQADTLIRAWIRGSQDLAELAGQQVKGTLLRRLEESAVRASRPAQSFEETKKRWDAFIDTDTGIASVVESIAGRGGAIVEISIADQAGRVLVSSARARAGRRAAQPQPLNELERMNAVARFRSVFAASTDYGHSIPIGVQGESKPLYTIQILVSNVLLRDAVGPGMRRIVWIAAGALALSLLLVYAVAAFTTANLKRIGTMIDQIGGGKSTTIEGNIAARTDAFPAAEFAAVGSKLNLLDSRVRDAMQDAEQYRSRVNVMLERLEEAILLFDEDRLVLAAGPVEPLLGATTDQIARPRRRDVLPPGNGLGDAIEKAFAARQSMRDEVVQWNGSAGERRLIVNLDFIGSGRDAARTAALLRVRDAEGAGEVESQLELSTRLEAINRLTGGVAHEIKNPLNAISARLAVLESIVAEEAPEAEEQVRTIAEQIERLDRVVRTFLDFTRPLEIARDRVDLAGLGREVAHMLRPDAERRGIALTFEAAGERTLLTHGDRDLLTQAILNIAVNGLEAMDAGGSLSVLAEESAGTARLRITDTGPGIPAEQLGKIFDLYFTTKKNGSGIGLATAYRTLQLHGGELSVESHAGAGTAFTLSLPMLRMEEVFEKSSSNGFAAGANGPA